MTQLLALTIGGKGNGGGTQYPVNVPGQIVALNHLSLQHIVQWAIYLALSVTTLLAFIFLLIGGIKWMASQGDKKQVDEAQKTITYAIVGLLVVFLSFFIINLIGYAFGVPLIGNPITGQ